MPVGWPATAFGSPRAKRADLPADPASPGVARALVTHWCAEWSLPADLAESARLVVSELTTNALLHARTPMVLMADLAAEGLLLSVVDGDVDRPVVRSAGFDAEGGRGLAMIQAIGGQVETVPTPVGKAVACLLPVRDAQAPASTTTAEEAV